MVQVINSDASVLEALKCINEALNWTVFVVNDNGAVIGSLTDGDVRRYLINGGQLNDEVINAARKEFTYVKAKDVDLIKRLREVKKKGVKLVPSLDENLRLVDVYDLMSFKSHLPLDAVIMAGGKGERLRPITETIPKPLVEVGGKCIIDYNVDRLIDYGVKNINVTVNYLGDQIINHYTEPRNGVKVQTVREPKYLGTMGSIRFVKEFMNDTILVMNSDLFTNIDFEDFYLHFKEHNAMMSVAAVPYSVKIPFGIFELDGRNIQGVTEKPVFNYYANAGIYLIKKEILSFIPQDQFFNATDLIDAVVESGNRVIRYPLNGTWIDIGTHQELAKARDLVKHLG
jgi:dTDP-glucose pyrophosphorylase